MKNFFSQISIKQLTVLLIRVNNLLLLIFSSLIPSLLTESIELLRIFLLGRARQKSQQTIAQKQVSQTASVQAQLKKKKKRRRRRKGAPSLEDALWFKVKQLNPRHYTVGGAMVVLGILNGMNIYHNSQKIAQDIEDQSRGPASFPAAMRKPYFNAEHKHTHLSSLHIPIYLEKGPKAMSSMQIEFIFETSNRYFKKYIQDNEEVIRDHILTTLEPITAQFLFTPEGHEVIRLKILRELNVFTKQKKIQGQIKMVSFGSVIAG